MANLGMMPDLGIVAYLGIRRHNSGRVNSNCHFFSQIGNHNLDTYTRQEIDRSSPADRLYPLKGTLKCRRVPNNPDVMDGVKGHFYILFHGLQLIG
jgi:hypothetical protein